MSSLLDFVRPERSRGAWFGAGAPRPWFILSGRRRRQPKGSGRAVVFGLALTMASPALAQSALPPAEYADRQLADSRQEAQAKALMETLRCLVCQGQSIADSDAEMAGDMRALVRRRIEAGESPEDVRAWLVARYGNWVSYSPPVEPATWPLWAAPILLVGAGLYLARGRFKRRGA